MELPSSDFQISQVLSPKMEVEISQQEGSCTWKVTALHLEFTAVNALLMLPGIAYLDSAKVVLV